MNNAELHQLHELARLYRLETHFRDGLGQAREATPECILAVLRSLGAPLHSLQDVPEAIKSRQGELARELVPPVSVIWEGDSPYLHIRSNEVVRLRLGSEAGPSLDLELEPADEQPDLEDKSKRRFLLPQDLPCGYHRVCIEVDGRRANSLLIVSPRLAATPADGERRWGVFLPLYAVRSQRNWGAGDFTDLQRLLEWVGEVGGDFVGTLPLFSTFLDRPFDPSPYAPISRLFWNEFFVDPTQTKEWQGCMEARELFSSASFQSGIERQRGLNKVDYRDQMRRKRAILELLAGEFCRRCANDNPSFQDFKSESVSEYARFRAAQEQTGQPWSLWPERMRRGRLERGDYSSKSRDYHLYVQWVAESQLRNIHDLSRRNGVGLYLDLPLGVNPDGYDVWKHQDLFAPGVAGGAPPDNFFRGGQNWGFRPLHPERLQQQGYGYFREIIQHLTGHSDLLRIDHVMSLHRLYWVPEGFDASDGLYVRYPWEELFAILTLESQRRDCPIVGEDLGTVPPETRQSMEKHGIHRMYVSIFEFSTEETAPVNPVPPLALAALNTHDTATFAAFWQGYDLERLRRMARLDDHTYNSEVSRRAAVRRAILDYFGVDEESADQFTVLRELLVDLSRSEARYMLLNLEDFWLETDSQNLPGTGLERPNWRGKTRLTFEQFSTAPDLLQVMSEIASNRGRSLDDM